ncbi:hypothetical protein K1719_024125 [Acacia pycnantha]|nr:hypothetical protein K1719_024125 [Acacia pycnantha]
MSSSILKSLSRSLDFRPLGINNSILVLLLHHSHRSLKFELKRYIVEVKKAKEAATPSFGPVYRSLFAKDGFRPPIEGLDSCWDVFRCLSNSVAKLQYSRKIQARAIPPLLIGKDVLAVVIICPTRELAIQTIPKPVEHPSELPKWNYDGSSTGQAPGEDSEVILYPQAIFKDPFRGGNNILVVCEYTSWRAYPSKQTPQSSCNL